MNVQLRTCRLTLIVFVLLIPFCFSMAQEHSAEPQSPTTTEGSTASAGDSPTEEAAELDNVKPKASKSKARRSKRRSSRKRQTPKFNPQISWYEPAVSSTKRKRVQQVTLYGETEEGIRVLLGKKLIWVTTTKKGKKKVKKISLNKLRVKGKKMILRTGERNFEINLRLPNGEVQIPVRLKKGRQKVSYQLTLNVQAKEIKLKDQKSFKTDCTYCIWFGVGANYLAYQQDPPQNIKDVDYGAFGGPALSLRTNFRLSKSWRIRFDYHQLSGPELSSNTVIQNKSIAWQHMGLEVDYRALNPFRLFGLKFDPAILVGAQSQDMPFLTEVSTNIFTIDSFKFNTISIGGLFFVNNHKRFYYEVYMRGQMALSSSGDISLTSGFAFDGSVGAIYRMGENLRFGVFWGGQYHSYGYEINSEEGTYSLLSSKIDLALGYEF